MNILSLFYGHDLMRFRLVRWIHPFYKSLYGTFAPRSITVFGRSLELDENDVLEYARQGENYELETTQFFLQEIESGMLFWDIGAHIGYFSILAESRGANVIAWECAESDREILRKNITGFVLGRFPDELPTLNFDIAKVDVELDAVEAIEVVINHAKPHATLVLEWIPEFLQNDEDEVRELLSTSGFKEIVILDKRNKVFKRT